MTLNTKLNVKQFVILFLLLPVILFPYKANQMGTMLSNIRSSENIKQYRW